MAEKDAEFALEAVPQGQRSGFWKMLAVMLGMSFFSASMLSGSELAAGLTLFEFIGIVMAGNLILGLYTGALAYIASKTGLSTHLLTRYSFGKKGAVVPSLLLGGTQVGWFGVGVAMFAVPVHKLTDINIYVIVIGIGLIMTATAYFGMRALTILSMVAVPAIALLGSYAAVDATEAAGGMQALLDYEPAETMSIAVALTACIGSFASAGTLTPDFARFAKTKRTAAGTTMIAFFLGNTLMFAFGAVGTFAFGVGDISEVLFRQGLIIPGIIILGLNIWTTNDNALYASGLGFASITGLSKGKMVLMNGIAGTIMALWLYNHFMGFLDILGSTLPPIGAIILADYLLVRRGSYQAFASVSLKAVNWPALAAWMGGAAAGHLLPGIPPVNGIVTAAVFYTAVMFITERFRNQKAIQLYERAG